MEQIVPHMQQSPMPARILQKQERLSKGKNTDATLLHKKVFSTFTCTVNVCHAATSQVRSVVQEQEDEV